MPRETPVSPQDLVESTGFVQMPPRTSPPGNTDTQVLSASTRSPVEENTSTKKSNLEEEAQHTDDQNLQPRIQLYAVSDIPPSEQDSMHNRFSAKDKDLQTRIIHISDMSAGDQDELHKRSLANTKDLQFGTLPSGTTAMPVHQTDETMEKMFLPRVKESFSTTYLPTSTQEDTTNNDTLLPKINDSMFAESDKKDVLQELRPVNSEEESSDGNYQYLIR